MKFTPEQKLILSMLCDIYEHHGIKGDINHKLVEQAITTGNTWALTWEYPALSDSEENSETIAKDICKTLTMWGYIESSYKALSDADKKAVDDAIKPYKPVFEGYDGNNESNYMSVAHMLTHSMHRFSEFSGRDLNAHTPSVGRYHRMYEVFEDFRDKIDYVDLTSEQIITIIKAGKPH